MLRKTNLSLPAGGQQHNVGPATAPVTSSAEKIAKLRETANRMFQHRTTDLTNTAARQALLEAVSSHHDAVRMTLARATNRGVELEAATTEAMAAQQRNKGQVAAVDHDCSKVADVTALLKEALDIAKRNVTACENNSNPNRGQWPSKPSTEALERTSVLTARLAAAKALITGVEANGTVPPRARMDVDDALPSLHLADAHDDILATLRNAVVPPTAPLRARLERVGRAMASAGPAMAMWASLVAEEAQEGTVAASRAALETDHAEGVAAVAAAEALMAAAAAEALAAEKTTKASEELRDEVVAAHDALAAKVETTKATAAAMQHEALTLREEVQGLRDTKGPSALAALGEANGRRATSHTALIDAEAETVRQAVAHAGAAQANVAAKAALASAEESRVGAHAAVEGLTSHVRHFATVVRTPSLVASIMEGHPLSSTTSTTPVVALPARLGPLESQLRFGVEAFTRECDVHAKDVADRVHVSISRVMQYDVESEDDVVE